MAFRERADVRIFPTPNPPVFSTPQPLAGTKFYARGKMGNSCFSKGTPITEALGCSRGEATLLETTIPRFVLREQTSHPCLGVEVGVGCLACLWGKASLSQCQVSCQKWLTPCTSPCLLHSGSKDLAHSHGRMSDSGWSEGSHAMPKQNNAVVLCYLGSAARVHRCKSWICLLTKKLRIEPFWASLFSSTME